jgi:branched-chain amino acid transport system permease protein
VSVLTREASPASAEDPAGHGAHDGGGGPTTLGVVARISFLVGVAMIVIFLPTTIDDLLSFATQAAIFAVVGLSLNVIIGYTGQLSSGHNGFVGIGAFTAAYALTVQGVPFASPSCSPPSSRRCSPSRSGWCALRITGLYLSLITLVFGLTLETTLFEVPELTNAGAGQPADLPDYFLTDPKRYYWLCLVILAVAIYFDWRLLRSKVGRALLALKENERVAEAFGVNVTGYKLLAFTFSGLLAGVAGAMFAYFSGSVVGTNFGFSTFLFLTFVLMVVVGGAGSRVGVVVGSAFFGLIDYLLRSPRSSRSSSTGSSACSARPAWLPSSSRRSSSERCCSSSRSSSTPADRAAAPPDHPLAVRQAVQPARPRRRRSRRCGGLQCPCLRSATCRSASAVCRRCRTCRSASTSSRSSG